MAFGEYRELKNAHQRHWNISQTVNRAIDTKDTRGDSPAIVSWKMRYVPYEVNQPPSEFIYPGLAVFYMY